ncbi:N-alpha-acetyltransferase 80 [Aricia agestis]|uniref:N-alpha-acetyltransferase 80 n=1 Tax=Aricia agestis TaxID=91739 RepID=UPI001C201C0F|nr:N-alpha-acetyltransferase 80 [Aricia agestis]
MEFKNLRVKPLHKFPQYLIGCCDLLNDEWPRSRTARMLSLEASSDKLPTSLILLDEEVLLGHCKLTPIPSLPNSCFLEAVVIKKSMRGKKLGTHLMRQVEEYCRNVLKLDMIHLSTKGQEQFYAKLGYEVCPPISIFGSSIPTISTGTTSIQKGDSKLAAPCIPGGNPPPPPPPLPSPVPTTASTLKTSKTYMCRHLVGPTK